MNLWWDSSAGQPGESRCQVQARLERISRVSTTRFLPGVVSRCCSSCSTACPLTPALSENLTSLLQLVCVEGPPKLLLLGWVWGAPPRLSPEWGFAVEQVTISAN